MGQPAALRSHVVGFLLGLSVAVLACGGNKAASHPDGASDRGGFDGASDAVSLDGANDGGTAPDVPAADVVTDLPAAPQEAGGDVGVAATDGALGPDSCRVSATPNPSPLCAGKSPCAIVAHTELGCGPEVAVIGSPSVAPGTAGGGYAMLSAVGASGGRMFLFTLDATGKGSGEIPSFPCGAGSRAGFGLVRATPSGEARVFEQCATSAPTYATEALRLVSGSWQAEWSGAGVLRDAGFGAGGRTYALLGPDHDVVGPTTAALATGTAQGAWSTGAPVTALAVALAIDSDGGAQVVTAQAGTPAGQVTFHALSSAGDRTLLQLAGNPARLKAAAAGKPGDAHDLVVATALSPNATDLHALLPSAAGYQDVALPELSEAARTTCPDGNFWASQVGAVCPSPMCTLVGDVNGPFGLATTVDGTVWLAAVVRHVDEDVTHAQNGLSCRTSVTADRSTQDLVVQRIVLGAPPRVGAASRFPLLGTLGLLDIGVAASGTRLYVTIVDGTTEPSLAKYVVVDTSLLP